MYTFKPEAHPIILSAEDKNIMYAIGHSLYQGKQYTEAISFFALLSTYEPANSTYYAAIAACQKMLKEYDQAIYHYTLASLTTFKQAEQFDYILKMIECQIADGHLEMAIQGLERLSNLKTEPFSVIGNMQKRVENWLNILR